MSHLDYTSHILPPVVAIALCRSDDVKCTITSLLCQCTHVQKICWKKKAKCCEASCINNSITYFFPQTLLLPNLLRRITTHKHMSIILIIRFTMQAYTEHGTPLSWSLVHVGSENLKITCFDDVPFLKNV